MCPCLQCLQIMSSIEPYVHQVRESQIMEPCIQQVKRELQIMSDTEPYVHQVRESQIMSNTEPSVQQVKRELQTMSDMEPNVPGYG